MKKYILEIPDMQSAHCRSRVALAAGKIDGVTVVETNPGLLEVMVPDESFKSEVIEAIENVGYPVASVRSENETRIEKLKFNTNINCGGCVNKVKPFLDDAEGICDWRVDLTSGDKILEVNAEGISEAEVIEKVKKAGFKIERRIA